MAARREGLYMISVAASLAGVHPQTLRIYEQRQLIQPTRTPKGTRLYSDEKLADALRLCLEAETLLKSSSGRDPSLVVRGVLYSIIK